MPKKTPPLPEPPWQVILEDIRATLEAVECFEGRYARDRADDRARMDGRFDRDRGRVARALADIREIKTDVAAIKTDLRRVDGKVDHLSALEPRVAALERPGD